ncbi:MAG: hypothetical protein K0R90_1596 [Oscillospiraceae bacterium]|jgi:NACalpha-BTF3-like transcription factor|nr:hypothetical protein [Oscillospiraceae bacterium]
MKKLICALLSVVTIAALSLTAFAAPGISANSQEILDLLSTTVTTKSGAKMTLPAEYLNQAKNYLMGSDVDITDEQLAASKAQIQEAISLVEESSATSLADLPLDVKSALVEKAQAVAETNGLSLTYASTAKKVTIKDTDGKVVFEASNVIKKTGADYSVYFAVSALLLIVAAAGGIVVLKNKKAVVNA